MLTALCLWQLWGQQCLLLGCLCWATTPSLLDLCAAYIVQKCPLRTMPVFSTLNNRYISRHFFQNSPTKKQHQVPTCRSAKEVKASSQEQELVIIPSLFRSCFGWSYTEGDSDGMTAFPDLFFYLPRQQSWERRKCLPIWGSQRHIRSTEPTQPIMFLEREAVALLLTFLIIIDTSWWERGNMLHADKVSWLAWLLWPFVQ